MLGKKLLKREADETAVSEQGQAREVEALDLRSEDRSASLDRSAHRRSTWLYEDMLN